MSEKTITVRMRKDGQIVELLPDGSESPFPEHPIRAMTEQEVLKAALDDPDAQPLSEADFVRMKRTPSVRIIRRALQLTQEEFAKRYSIPLGTLRDWEQGRSTPGQTVCAYLKVIAADPSAVQRALNSAPLPQSP